MRFRISDFGFRIFQPPPLNVAWVGRHSEFRIPNSEFSSYCLSLELISVIENSVLVRRIER
jgi:hypothetical protein